MGVVPFSVWTDSSGWISEFRGGKANIASLKLGCLFDSLIHLALILPDKSVHHY